MNEFEKWLEKMHDENENDVFKYMGTKHFDFFKGIDRALVETIIKYRSMTCKMNSIPNYIAFGDDESMNTMSAYRCSVCGATTLDCACSYCSSCGRKVMT